MGQGLWRLIQLDTPHSIGLLWTSDQPDTEAFTWQHTTPRTERHLRTGGTRTRNYSKQGGVDTRLRPRSQSLWASIIAAS
jgi:hypothetical protein